MSERDTRYSFSESLTEIWFNDHNIILNSNFTNSLYNNDAFEKMNWKKFS